MNITRYIMMASVVWGCATFAHAGGFEVPDNGVVSLGRGGAYSVRADDPMALAYNPGALIKLKGTRVLYDHALIFENVTFTRQASDLPPGRDYGFSPTDPVSNEAALFPLGAALAASTDFGLENWSFAFGVYGPSAHGSKRYPVSGGQRYLLTEMDALIFYPSLAIAYGERDHYGFGVTLQAVMAPSLNMSLVVDGSPGGRLSAYHSANDVLAHIEMQDMLSFSAIFGAWYRPIPELELGLSGRIIPTTLSFEGDFTLANVGGQADFSDQQLRVDQSSARMQLVLPPTARLGARYRHLAEGRELFDIEFNAVYEAWSMVERYHVELEGQINLFAGAEAPDTVIEKRWRDTLSVRLGGTWNILEGTGPFGRDIGDLQVSLGGFYESGAVPHGYEHLDFLSFNRGGIGVGLAGRLGPVRIKAAYSHVFQEDREVDERFGKVYQQRPLDPCPGECDDGAGWSGVPANAGRFQSSYDIVSVGIEAAF